MFASFTHALLCDPLIVRAFKRDSLRSLSLNLCCVCVCVCARAPCSYACV
jgi:hypothetical protein